MRLLRSSLLPVLALLLLTACATPGGGGGGGVFALKPEQVSGEARLPGWARPVSYEVGLRVDPSREEVSGRALIEVELLEAQDHLLLHADGLRVESAEVRQGGERIEAQVVVGTDGGLGIALGRPASAGRLSVALTWSGPLSERPDGLYRVQEGGRWYAFTQFEPLEARTAFPCFDEPGFKVPIRLEITAPTGLVVAANTPVESAREVEPGWTATRFEATPPMPTYLVALAVGPFDVAEAPAGAIGAPPLRILATAGKGGLARYALERTPVILASLERWFGTPYPYRKLDLVAVPNFTSGAMENAGLVTFREQLLLVDPADASAWQLRGAQSVIAHELAHMWFGDLVTMAWWDDLWLNEAFATWMASRTLSEVAPEFDEPLRAVASRSGIMADDARETSTPIKKVITDSGDIRNAFDGITYAKGAAVLRMLEAWLGPEAFQAGVRRYLQAHAWGNATEADLMEALSAASGQDVASVARVFIRQAGVPEISAALVCDGSAQPRLKLTQRRYAAPWSEARVTEAWTVPVCVRYGGPGGEGRTCALVGGSGAEVALPVATCPAWVHPNADEVGYYRWEVAPEALRRLALEHRARLSAAERVGLVAHLRAGLESGALDGPTWAALLRGQGEDAEPAVVNEVVGVLRDVSEALPEDAATRRGFGGLVRGLLADDAARIGALPREGEGIDTRSIRGWVLTMLARYGDDAQVQAQAQKIVAAWLKDRGAHTVETVSWALPLAASRGDAALWEALRAALPGAQTPAEREALLSGLGSFEAPALLERSLELLLDGTLRAQDYRSIVRPIPRGSAAQRVFWGWFTRRFEALAALRGPRGSASLPWAAAGFCDAAGRQEAADFFASRPDLAPGSAQNLAQALEEVEQCSRLRERLRGAFKE